MKSSPIASRQLASTESMPNSRPPGPRSGTACRCEVLRLSSRLTVSRLTRAPSRRGAATACPPSGVRSPSRTSSETAARLASICRQAVAEGKRVSSSPPSVSSPPRSSTTSPL